MMRFAAAACFAAIALVSDLRDVRADPLTYSFTWVATAGPLAGTSANGTFTFDSGLIPLGGTGQISGTDFFTDFAFTFNGISYDEGDVQTAILGFKDGALNLAVFGTNCIPGLCMVDPGLGDWFSRTLGPAPDRVGTFLHASPAGLTNGSAVIQAVNEPGSLALVLVGLVAAGVGFMRRRTAGGRKKARDATADSPASTVPRRRWTRRSARRA